jgi:hypothetical protein
MQRKQKFRKPKVERVAEGGWVFLDIAKGRERW